MLFRSVDVLRDKVELCLMPEGKQSFKRTLFPLVKGMFRIAFKAQQEQDKNVVIVPVGIDYDEYIKPGKDWVIRFGKPIEVKSYMDVYEENQAKGLNALRDDVYNAISDLIQNIRSKENYELIYELSRMGDANFCRKNGQKTTPCNLLNARREITMKLDAEETNNIDFIAKLHELYHTYQEKLKSLSLTDAVVEKPNNILQIVFKTILFVLGLPLFAYGWIGNVIPAYSPQLIVNKLKTDDFKSSFSYVLWLVLYPVYYLLIFIILWIVFQSALASFSIVSGFMLLGKFAFVYRKYFLGFYNQFCLLKAKFLRKQDVEELIRTRKEIVLHFT